MHKVDQQRCNQRIEMGRASKETKGNEGPIMDSNQAQQRIPGITAD